ncbi:MAG: hypothetical protein JSR28_10455 [Proteobacteria bacterium]|nr:hypothetical protein [Pseudomonadota bacterium]
MLTFAIASLFACLAVAATAVIAASLHGALPRIAGLRRDLALCSDTAAVRIRIIETIVCYDDGKVVALPLRPRRPAAQGLRAAA